MNSTNTGEQFDKNQIRNSILLFPFYSGYLTRINMYHDVNKRVRSFSQNQRITIVIHAMKYAIAGKNYGLATNIAKSRNPHIDCLNEDTH